MRAVQRTVWFAVDHFGDAYFAVLAAVGILGVAAAVAVAVVAGSWLFALVALAVPAFWLYMWLTR